METRIRTPVILRSWNSDSAKIQRRIFLKREILFGADSSADWKLSGDEGFVARLDLHSQELHYIAKDSSQKIEEGEFFQLGSQIFQWTQLRLMPNRLKVPTILASVGALLLFVMWVWPEQKIIQCDAASNFLELSEDELGALEEKEKNLWSRWQRGLLAFDEASSHIDLLLARAELQQLHRIYHQTERAMHCPLPNSLASREILFSEALILRFLDERNLKGAAKEFQALRSRIEGTDLGESLDTLREEIRKSAKQLAWEAWRVEPKDSTKAFRIRKQLKDVCESLSEPPNCAVIAKGDEKPSTNPD